MAVNISSRINIGGGISFDVPPISFTLTYLSVAGGSGAGTMTF
jgi:hypothetical protein